MGSGRQNDPGFIRGRQRVTADYRTGRDLIVEDNPNDIYAQIRGPRASKGNPTQYDALTRSGWQASVLWEEMVPRDTVLTFLNDPTDITEPQLGPSPFNVQATLASLVGLGTLGTPLGGAEGLAQVVYGAMGVSKTLFFNAPPGMAQVFAVSCEASECQPLITPKYWFPNDSNPLQRTYDIAPGNGLNNVRWNQPDSHLLQQFIGATVIAGTNTQKPILTNVAQSWAYYSDGHAYVDNRSRPSRRFSGSIARDGTAFHTFSIAPRAWNCDFVELNGGQLDAGGNPISVQFMQEQVINAQNRLIGPFPANQAIPLLDKVERIWVTTAVPVAAGSADTLYELNFYLGF
jgi:hypothetical protein